MIQGAEKLTIGPEGLDLSLNSQSALPRREPGEILELVELLLPDPFPDQRTKEEGNQVFDLIEREVGYWRWGWRGIHIC